MANATLEVVVTLDKTVRALLEAAARRDRQRAAAARRVAQAYRDLDREASEYFADSVHWLGVSKRAIDECDAAQAERDAANARAARLAKLLQEMYDPTPCRLDHHGLCQEHFSSEAPCIMRRVESELWPAPAQPDAGDGEQEAVRE